MSPHLKGPLVYAIAAVVAVTIGVWIAEGTWLAVAAVASVVLLSALGYLAPTRTHIVTLGVLLIGYIVGNRGFAQITPASGAPLFPAEMGLIISGSLLLAQCCVRRRTPIEPDGLNFTICLWGALAIARVAFDLKRFGFDALRDFALVYYAAFFFIAQTVFSDAQDPSRWFHRCILWATAPLPIFLYFFNNYTAFFTQTLTLRGIPLIFYKGDLVGTFLSVGSVAWYLYFVEHSRRWWALVLSLALAGAVLTTENRASLLALVVAAIWLGVGRRWRFLAILCGAGTAAILTLFIWGQFAGTRMEDTPLRGLYENISSITDVHGTGRYSGPFQKGDNNRFRLVWWTTAAEETIHTSPWVGMGFGYDLADQFLKTYYPESGDDFSVRSPHNVCVTIFARMGAVGLLAFIAVVMAMANATNSAVKWQEAPHRALPWCVAWAILTSSVFGVVLEGPMGAVVFWIALGIGNAERITRRLQKTASDTVPDELRNKTSSASKGAQAAI